LSHALLSVNASDAQKIDETNRDYLHRTLAAVPEPNPRMRRRQYVSFCEAIIRAMEQIGDERALKAMERIANMSGRSPARLRLKRAAADCLPALRERIREEAAPDLLLRAAVSESDAELLRPTTNTAQPDSVTLLRPTQ
jgi:hypothetical protein